MRIRSTKPEFWRSKTIALLDWDTRLVLKALESYVDDNGVGKDSVVIFCADAFPHDLANSPEVCAKVSRSLSRLAEMNIIVRYVLSGEELVYVRHWRQWQYIDKPKQGRYPRPDGTMNYRDAVNESIGAGHSAAGSDNREVSPEPREDFAKTSRKPPEECPQIQSGEQGNRGTGEQDDDYARGNFDEPPYDPDAEPSQAVDVDAPAVIDMPNRPAKPQPTSASRTVVRQVLGTAGYPRTIIDRLAVQVSQLAREGHPDALIREALTEWDRRDDCSKPEFLPTVLGDLVKADRAVAGVNGKPVHKLRSLAELAREVREQENRETLETVPPLRGIQ